jgi:hypothetical protein
MGTVMKREIKREKRTDSYLYVDTVKILWCHPRIDADVSGVSPSVALSIKTPESSLIGG